MGRVTICLDDETLDRARAAARSQGMSLSKWVAELLRQGTLSCWPNDVRELAGAWSDLPLPEELPKSPKRNVSR
jgi:hypothetical protein